MRCEAARTRVLALGGLALAQRRLALVANGGGVWGEPRCTLHAAAAGSLLHARSSSLRHVGGGRGGGRDGSVTVAVAMAVVAAEVAAAGEVEAAEAAAAEAEAVGWTVGASGGGASLPMPTLPELRTVPTGRPAATPAAERDTLSLIGCVLSLGRSLPTLSKDVTLPLTSRIMSPAISPAASASPSACTFVTWMSVAGRGG